MWKAYSTLHLKRAVLKPSNHFLLLIFYTWNNAAERLVTSLGNGISLGDMLFEGMAYYCNLSIKTKDFEGATVVLQFPSRSELILSLEFYVFSM